MATIQAKNVELYVGTIASGIEISTRANNKSIAKYIDDEVTASGITGWTKVSGISTEIAIEPAEDDSEIIKYFGSTSAGAQNTETQVTTNNDIDVTLTTDSEFLDTFTSLALNDGGITHSDYSNYKSFNLGNTSSTLMLMFVRIKRLIGTTYYYRNIAIVEPTIKKVPLTNGSADDNVMKQEYTLLGDKSKAYLDYYSGSVEETLTNM